MRKSSALPAVLFSTCAFVSTAFPGDLFVDVTEERGIDFRIVDGARGERYLVETMLAGAAWVDVDRDGFLDLYLVQGHEHPERALGGPAGKDAARNRLYRSVRGERFEDITDRAGLGDRGYGMGVVVGDYDRDGAADIYVTNYGRNTLYRNRGDGTFEDVTAEAGVGAPGWSTSASWADFDGDGWLDLYVATYLDYDTRVHGACRAEAPGGGEVAAYCHPQRFEGAPDVLYRNRGDGRFEDVSVESGIAGSRGWLAAKGLGVAATDFDRDGDVDFLVANDSVANTLWRNGGDGRFEDAALDVGFALNADGTTEAGMGIVRGDADGDGAIDVFVTNFSRETNTLYATTDGFFIDVTVERGVARGSYLPLGFGTVFLDHDLDGDLDIYVANGHVLDNVEALHPGEGITHAQRDSLLENTGRGRFRDISSNAGRWFRRPLVGRGVAAGDYDNDGDTDLVVTHAAGGPAVLLENRAPRSRAWIGLDLRAPDSVTHNSTVEIERPGRRRVREAQTDGSYLSAHDPRIVFALPGDGRTDGVGVRVGWHGGGSELFRSLVPGRYVEIAKGSGE